MSANWTPEQKKWLKKYLKPQIDRVWNYWPPRLEARTKANGKRYGMQICCECKGEFMRADTDVDHLSPTVPVGETGFENPGEYISRRFCQSENLRVVCKPCHRKKTSKENSARRVLKKSKKISKKTGRILVGRRRG